MKTTPNLKTLSKEVYEANKAKGFHSEEISNETLLMLVVAELSEAVGADRKGKKAQLGVEAYSGTFDPKGFELWVKNTVEDELADAAIRLFDLAGLRNVSVAIDKQLITEDLNMICEETFPESIYHICRTVLKNAVNANDELKDVIKQSLSSIVAICEQMNIDLWYYVELKLQYNKARPDKHGKKY